MKSWPRFSTCSGRRCTRSAGSAEEEAKRRLLERLDAELQHEAGAVIIKHERRIAENLRGEVSRGDDHGPAALRRHAHTAETTTSTVDIPNDDMKGRIIGREGRNIRAFEKATGVDVIIDDTPGVVIVSGFDMVRREVARISLAKLIADGRIHPTRIEEIVAETQAELEKHLQKLGEEAAQEADVPGLHEAHPSARAAAVPHQLQPERAATLDRSGLPHRHDGRRDRPRRQAGPRAAGCCTILARRPTTRPKAAIPRSAPICSSRYGERPEVVHAALGHHDDLRIENPYTVLVAAADACSASRPGARRETLERYIKRMEELETIAGGFPGVEQAFAIQAGRELRVLVSAKDTTDSSAAKICRDIAKAFEEHLTYPGEIKVTVLRESRFTEVAK